MELFFVLIPITIVLVGLSIWAFLWSARNDQFEDLDKQAYSIFFDDDEQLAQKDPLSIPDKEDAAR
jgi:cbb3-type cytochrome oxidase maturation protein